MRSGTVLDGQHLVGGWCVNRDRLWRALPLQARTAGEDIGFDMPLPRSRQPSAVSENANVRRLPGVAISVPFLIDKLTG